jgi:hypothetical protein
MVREIKLTELEGRLSDLSYPVSRETAAEELSETTLLLADGEVSVGDIVDRSTDDGFGSAAELAVEVRALLPREAVGEPGQSEGEG